MTDVQNSDTYRKKSIYFEIVKSVALGTVFAVCAGTAASILNHSRPVKHLVLPTLDELNTLLNDKTTLAVGATFGYFGFRDAIRHNREVTKLHSTHDERNR